MGLDAIVHQAAHSLHTTDKTLFQPLVSISVVPRSESATLHLLAVSQNGESAHSSRWVWMYTCSRLAVLGVRFYFTTTPNGIMARPSLLALVHVRLPPGFSPSSAANRPGNTVHQVFYRKGDSSIGGDCGDVYVCAHCTYVCVCM